MLGVLAADAFLLKDFEEVLTLEENHRKVFCFRLHILFKDHVLEEILGRHVLIQQVKHKHDHDLNRFLI